MVDHAACDGNQGLGVLASNLSDGLTALLVARIGDGTGVHNENVSCAIVVSNLITFRLEPRRQSIGFIEVHSAT